MKPAGPGGEPEGAERVAVAEELDVFEARWLVRRTALAIGFSFRDAEELVLVASELATNILKFARPGEIAVERLDDPGRGRGIRISARDPGPPFDDLSQILAQSTLVGTAREWTGRGLGGGLGAVYRFTDLLDCVPHAGGKQIVAERFLRRPRQR